MMYRAHLGDDSAPEKGPTISAPKPDPSRLLVDDLADASYRLGFADGYLAGLHMNNPSTRGFIKWIISYFTGKQK